MDFPSNINSWSKYVSNDNGTSRATFLRQHYSVLVSSVHVIIGEHESIMGLESRYSYLGEREDLLGEIFIVT